MKVIDLIAMILLIIGGLNWGLVGLLDMNLVEMIFAGMGIQKLIYILVGASAVWKAVCFFKKGCCTT